MVVCRDYIEYFIILPTYGDHHSDEKCICLCANNH